MKITIRTIANESGVSRGTVGRFVNHSGPVSEDAAINIKSAIKKLGGNVTQFTSLGRKKKTHLIGLLTSYSKDLFNSRYHTHLCSGIVTGLYETDYYLKFILLKEKDFANVEEMLFEYDIDGLLILTWRIHPNLIHLIEHAPKNLPVMVFNDYDPKLQVNCVYADVAKGTEMAVDYLVGKGRKKIGFLKGPSMVHFGHGKKALHVRSIDSYEKWEGFQKGMSKHKLAIESKWVEECETYLIPAGYQASMKILKGGSLPNALVCSNDETAIGALAALRELNIKCPDQVAVIGFDGIEKGELTLPPLTTIEQPLAKMGEEGAIKLIEVVEGKLSRPIHRKFSPKLIVRGSA